MLLQEEQFASRKHPRCQLTKENEAKKEEFPEAGGGGVGVQNGDPMASLGCESV